MKDKTMKHPAHKAHHLEAKLNAIHVLLTELKHEEKSAIVKLVKECKDTFKQYRQEQSEYDLEKQYKQRMYLDKLSFEFSTSADFSDSYSRHYEGIVSDMQIIKDIVYSERALMNCSDEMLYARITILDTDPN